MAISSEIDKLERRWHENPSGLMFAPLAEAYRKAGNHQRALEILEVGLSVHPDYVPALIVRGRCFQDAGDLAASESAFHQVLARDPGNPIALRSLADLYERSGRADQAMERLSLLLEVDAGDGDARASLARLRSQPAVESALVAASVTEAMPAVGDELEPIAEPAVPTDLAEAPAPMAVSPRLEPENRPEDAFRIENLSIDPMASGEQAMPAEPLGWEPTSITPQWSETVTLSLLEPAPQPNEPELLAESPSAPSDLDSAPAESVAVEAAREEPIATEAAPVELESGIWSTAGPTMEPMAGAVAPIIWTPAEAGFVPSVSEAMGEPEPAASQDAPLVEAPVVAEAEVAPEAEIPESQVAQEGAPPESPEAAALPWPAIEEPIVAEEPIGEEPAQPEPLEVLAAPIAEATPEEPTLIVTESMAELFLKQGHRELALAVYRQLAERAPEDARLREAIAALEGEFARAVPAPVPAAEPVHYAAVQTGGVAVESALQAVLRSPPPPSASTVLPPAIEPGLSGEATRATEQSLSLGAVFGDEPTAPPAPAADMAPAAAPAEPSYDEFFGAVPPGEPATSGSVAGRQSEAEDLRQFNEWLKGLKR
jgi:thioredoxin-like negative regulator of GroEL